MNHRLLLNGPTRLKGHRAYVNSCSLLAEDGMAVSASSDRKVIIWCLEEMRSIAIISHSTAVRFCCIIKAQSGGYLILTCEDDSPSMLSAFLFRKHCDPLLETIFQFNAAVSSLRTIGGHEVQSSLQNGEIWILDAFRPNAFERKRAACAALTGAMPSDMKTPPRDVEWFFDIESDSDHINVKHRNGQKFDLYTNQYRVEKAFLAYSPRNRPILLCAGVDGTIKVFNLLRSYTWHMLEADIILDRHSDAVRDFEYDSKFGIILSCSSDWTLVAVNLNFLGIETLSLLVRVLNPKFGMRCSERLKLLLDLPRIQSLLRDMLFL